MNRCEKYSELIEDFIGGELDELIAARTRAHVFACPNCRERCESLKREQEIYAQYLFGVEPPPDLSANFAARLATEKQAFAPPAEQPAFVAARRKNVFGFLRFVPAFAATAAILLAAFGFGWLKFAAPQKVAQSENAAKTNSIDLQTAAESLAKTENEETIDSATRFDDKTPFAPELIRRGEQDKSLNDKKLIAADFGKRAPKTEKTKIHAVNASGGERLNREKLAMLQLQTLETETAKQIEKAEMLLRSFRNASAASEDAASFDVAYEKRQARKLLEKNFALRRAAEGSGNLRAAELLNRVEPCLLDIANLDENPAPDKVQEIKDRVKNQNIIASLQTY